MYARINACDIPNIYRDVSSRSIPTIISSKILIAILSDGRRIIDHKAIPKVDPSVDPIIPTVTKS